MLNNKTLILILIYQIISSPIVTRSNKKLFDFKFPTKRKEKEMLNVKCYYKN